MRNYKFYLILLIFGGFFSSCEKKDDSVIDPVLSFPSILSASVSPNTYDTISINGVVKATVTSILPVTSVSAIIKNPLNAVVATITLKDDGAAPDSVAGDGNFTGRMNFSLSCKLVGGYTVGIIATNNSGLSSNQFNVTFSLSSSFNNRPVLTNVVMPDSLRRPSGTGDDSVIVSEIFAMPTDPDGLCDVESVFFYSFKPDGSISNQGNPIPLYDDGNEGLHCDAVAGDATFSVCIKIVNNPHDPFYTGPPQLGLYTFRFNAQDRGTPPLLSDTLIKHIFVHQ